jgi:enolase
VEDAIAASGANTESRKAFRIGINCEGESYFNKDPKDANKYEVEGAKNQHDQDQLADYYIKVCQEHPLVSYIEDPYAYNDFKGYQKFQAKLKANPAMAHVQVGLQGVLVDGGI